jgi:hypothetical protein
MCLGKNVCLTLAGKCSGQNVGLTFVGMWGDQKGFLPSADSKAVRRRPRKHFLTPDSRSVLRTICMWSRRGTCSIFLDIS